MSKLVYEKPEMLVEAFVPTQSVAATCGEQIQNVFYLKENELVCNGDGGKQDDGHRFHFENLTKKSNGEITITDANIDEWKSNDNELAVFSTKINGCELLYDVHAQEDVVELGRLLTGTRSFNSDKKHKVAIDGIVIGS